jgi:hypothetical protein
MDALRGIIRRFDDWLSARAGVAPFTDDPRVILRVQTGKAAHDLELPDGTICAGAKVLLIHLWNERMPLIPDGGADLAYGIKLQRLTINSYRAIARHLQAEPGLRDVQAVGGVSALASLREGDGGRAMFEQMGFMVLPYQQPMGAFGEFWENFYAWWLMWTYNPGSVRHRPLWRLQRTEFWMTQEAFLQKYG